MFAVLFVFVAIVFSLFAKYFTTIRVFAATDWRVHAVLTWCFLCNYSCIALWFSSWIKHPRELLGSQIFLIIVPIILHSWLFNSGLFGFYGQYTLPVDFFTRYYHPQNLEMRQFLVNTIPTYHYAKVIQNIYDVTGSNDIEGNPQSRSSRQTQERYLEQPNNATREYTWDLFWKPVGYSQDFGFPQEGLEKGFDIFQMPMEWTVTTRNPRTVQVPTETDSNWYSYNTTSER